MPPVTTVTVAIGKIRVSTSDRNTDEHNQAVSDSFWAIAADVEDLVNSQLPDGYYCKVEQS